MTRFGVQLANYVLPGTDPAARFRQLLDQARMAEAAGASSLWVMDRFWYRPLPGDPRCPVLEADTLLGALAASTSRVALGSFVSRLTHRNPAILAKEITAVDVISGGRAVLGLGAGVDEEDRLRLGLGALPDEEALARLEEAVAVCRALFGVDEADRAGTHWAGSYYCLDSARNRPAPVRPGGPPVLVEVSRDPRMLELGARVADVCGLSGSAPQLGATLDSLHQLCARMGRDPAQVGTARLGVLWLVGGRAEASVVTERIASGPSAMGLHTIGEPSEVAEQVRGLAETGVDELVFRVPGARQGEDMGFVAGLLAEALA